MANYQEGRLKLTNTQWNKLKSVAKNNTGTIWSLNKKNFLSLFLTTRQTTKIRNAFAKNMWTDIKLSKAQISKIIRLIGSFLVILFF